MSVPRTYVSKIENEKATPTLSSLERLARALEVTVPDLLSGGERTRQEEVKELMKDQFIAEMLAVRLATERDADVQHPDPGAGFDGTAAKKRVITKVSKFQGFKVSDGRAGCHIETLKPCHFETLLLSGQPANTTPGPIPWSRFFCGGAGALARPGSATDPFGRSRCTAPRAGASGAPCF